MSATNAEAEGFLTVPQAAARIGISPRKVYDLCHDKVIGHHKHGDTYRIPPAAVVAYLASTYVPAESEGAVA